MRPAEVAGYGVRGTVYEGAEVRGSEGTGPRVGGDWSEGPRVRGDWSDSPMARWSEGEAVNIQRLAPTSVAMMGTCAAMASKSVMDMPSLVDGRTNVSKAR